MSFSVLLQKASSSDNRQHQPKAVLTIQMSKPHITLPVCPYLLWHFLCYLASPSQFHPDLHSPTSVLTKRQFLQVPSSYWSHLAQHIVTVTHLNIQQYHRVTVHRGVTRASPFLSSASPELKVLFLQVNHIFLSNRSPDPLTNVAPLSTPWLGLLALSSGMGWRRQDASCLDAQGLWKHPSCGCYNTAKELKLEICKLGVGVVEKYCSLPYHHNLNQLKATQAKLAIAAVSCHDFSE